MMNSVERKATTVTLLVAALAVLFGISLAFAQNAVVPDQYSYGHAPQEYEVPKQPPPGSPCPDRTPDSWLGFDSNNCVYERPCPNGGYEPSCAGQNAANGPAANSTPGQNPASNTANNGGGSPPDQYNSNPGAETNPPSASNGGNAQPSNPGNPSANPLKGYANGEGGGPSPGNASTGAQTNNNPNNPTQPEASVPPENNPAAGYANSEPGTNSNPSAPPPSHSKPVYKGGVSITEYPPPAPNNPPANGGSPQAAQNPPPAMPPSIAQPPAPPAVTNNPAPGAAPLGAQPPEVANNPPAAPNAPHGPLSFLPPGLLKPVVNLVNKVADAMRPPPPTGTGKPYTGPFASGDGHGPLAPLVNWINDTIDDYFPGGSSGLQQAASSTRPAAQILEDTYTKNPYGGAMTVGGIWLGYAAGAGAGALGAAIRRAAADAGSDAGAVGTSAAGDAIADAEGAAANQAGNSVPRPGSGRLTPAERAAAKQNMRNASGRESNPSNPSRATSKTAQSQAEKQAEAEAQKQAQDEARKEAQPRAQQQAQREAQKQAQAEAQKQAQDEARKEAQQQARAPRSNPSGGASEPVDKTQPMSGIDKTQPMAAGEPPVGNMPEGQVQGLLSNEAARLQP
jgi:hypothetical protein